MANDEEFREKLSSLRKKLVSAKSPSSDGNGLQEKADRLFLEGKNRKAIPLYEKLSANGDPDNQYKLGLCHYGLDEEKEAFKWFAKAASQGHHPAESLLGDCYLYGEGVKENEKEAFKLYKKSAEGACPMGMVRLADAYENGYGVEEDEEMAFHWYKKAAESGEEAAYFPLAFAYHKGVGTKTDYGKAKYWYRKDLEENGESESVLSFLEEIEEAENS